MKKYFFLTTFLALSMFGFCNEQTDDMLPFQPTPTWKKWGKVIIKTCNDYTDAKVFPMIDLSNRMERAEANIVINSNAVVFVDEKVTVLSNNLVLVDGKADANSNAVVLVDGKVTTLSNNLETVSGDVTAVSNLAVAADTKASEAKTTAEAALPNDEESMKGSTAFVNAVKAKAPVTSVNNKTGDVTITSFEEFPASWKAVADGKTMEQFFAAVKDTNPEPGRCFLGGMARMTPAPTPALLTGNYEAIIKVPVWGVYVIEVTSTNVKPYRWYATWDTMFYGWRQIMNAETPENKGMYALRCTRNAYGSVEMYWDSYTDTTTFKKETLNTTTTAQPSTWQFDTSTAVLRYSATSLSTINFNFSVMGASDAPNGVYTWELIISSDQDIASCTMGTGVTYVGNDKTTNPTHSYARIDSARTYHVFAVRAFKTDSGFGNWQVAYNYSFKAE